MRLSLLSLPLPTMFRAVSRKKRNITVWHSPERMAKNQKMDVHPNRCIKNPPMTAPRLGAALVLDEVRQSQKL